MQRIGVLNTLPADDQHGQERIAAFLQALQQAGWTIGRNLRVDQRWSAGDVGELRKFAADLVALAPSLVLATGGLAVGPLLEVTRTVPIVFVNTPDPVGAGFVDSLARPGGNVTGFTQFEYSTSIKWLELLKQIAPAITRVGVLRDPNTPSGIGQFGALQGAASTFGVELIPIGVRDAAERFQIHHGAGTEGTKDDRGPSKAIGKERPRRSFPRAHAVHEVRRWRC